MTEPLFVEERNELILRHAENGWLLTVCSTGEPDMTYVFEEDEFVEEDHDPQAGMRLLQKLAELLGLSGGRYDKRRLVIRVEPGDKYYDDGRAVAVDLEADPFAGGVPSPGKRRTRRGAKHSEPDKG